MENLKIRMQEQIRIYKDSPNLTVTYCDLARLIEDLLFIISKIDKEKIGFNNGK